MARTMLTLTAAVALIYLALCAALFIFQRSLIYFPQPRALSPGTSMFTLPVDGALLAVTTRPLQGLTQDLQAKGALIYFGGNAEDVSYSLPGLAAAFPGHAVYLMHYRGYGGSTGAPSEAAIIKDALTLFDKVHAEHKNIVVVGRSLGSGVAVQLASQRPVVRLVLVTPYDSIAEIAARQFPVFPVRWLLQDKFESFKTAPQITMPTLIVAAEHDEVIPRASTDALFNSFRAGVAVFKVVARAGHNTISDSPDYMPLLKGAL